jgi:hypothetical protein
MMSTNPDPVERGSAKSVQQVRGDWEVVRAEGIPVRRDRTDNSSGAVATHQSLDPARHRGP